jgi:hypothetical protein
MTLALETRAPPWGALYAPPDQMPESRTADEFCPAPESETESTAAASDCSLAIQFRVSSTPARDLQAWILLAFASLLGAAFFAAVW